MNVYQWTYNKISKERKKTFIYKCARKLRKLLLHSKNEVLIDYKIGNTIFKMPFSSDLGPIFRDHPLYSYNLLCIAEEVLKKHPNSPIIDIGANVGDTIALLRNSTKNHILAIEPDPNFFKVLQINAPNLANVLAINCFLGEKDEKIKGELQISKGTAHIKESNEQIILLTLDRLLSAHPDFLNSKLVKIDTDGFDYKIIRGAKDFLSKSHPMLFFEYDPALLEKQKENPLSLFKFLFEIGYEDFLIYDNVGAFMFSITSKNISLCEEVYHYFLGEKSEYFCDICAFSQENRDIFARVRERNFVLKRNLQSAP